LSFQPPSNWRNNISNRKEINMNGILFRAARTAAERAIEMARQLTEACTITTGLEIQDDTGRWHPATPEDLMPSGDGSWRTARLAEPPYLAKRYRSVRLVRRWIRTLYLIFWAAKNEGSGVRYWIETLYITFLFWRHLRNNRPGLFVSSPHARKWFKGEHEAILRENEIDDEVLPK
jgi:hypothetical protein